MMKTKFFLLIFVGLLAACSRQTQDSPLQSQQPIQQFNSTVIPTVTATYPVLPSPAKPHIPTSGILQTDTSQAIEGVEVLIFTWNWPMMANIPPIHILKNGYAVWVTYGSDERYHVYETFLSPEEISKVQDTLTNSGYWEDPQQEATFSKHLVIWTSSSGHEKSVTAGNTKYKAVVSALQEILDISSNKTEYFPKYAYLFASHGAGFSERSYQWPDDEIDFQFGQALHGVYVEGKILLTIWEAVQRGDLWIASRGGFYKYALKIPGLSCIINYDKYMCNMVETP